MNIVIVDDEPLARDRLRRMIDALPEHEVVAEASDGDMALEVVARCQPEVVLLDVHMPGRDGLSVAQHLGEAALPPAVIYVTAHSEHALSAHNSPSAGYLLKPIRRADLDAALQRAQRSSRAQLGTDTQPGAADDPLPCISARVHDGIQRVPVADIVYFWADQKYTTVVHAGGELLIEQSLQTLEQSLGDRFMRVHRKALVARRAIAGLKRGQSSSPRLVLRGVDRTVPISRRRLHDVRALIESGINGT